MSAPTPLHVGLTRGSLTATIYSEGRGYLWFVTRGNAVVARNRRVNRTLALAKAAAGRAMLQQASTFSVGSKC